MATTTSAQNILRSLPEMARDKLPEEYWELVARYHGELVHQAFSILGNLQDSEDVVQETFCEVVREKTKLTEAPSVGAFLRMVNKANALNRLRSRKRESQRLTKKQREAPDDFATTGGFSQLDRREFVAQAIETLPEQLRETVVLRYWENLSYEEVSARLNIPLGTVKWRLCEAAVRLHEKLKLHLGTKA